MRRKANGAIYSHMVGSSNIAPGSFFLRALLGFVSFRLKLGISTRSWRGLSCRDSVMFLRLSPYA